MTKIIGHRGAAGLALENTIESIRVAREYNVDGIEFDIRYTKDKKIVLSHDRHLARISINTKKLAELDLSEVLEVELHNKHRIAPLESAIKACKDTPMIIEIKESGMAQELLNILARYNTLDITITSLWHDELRYIRKHRPELPILIRDRLSPIEIVATAKQMGATGINLNVWLLNPLTYWLAKKHGLSIMVYTVNSVLMARFLRRLYPSIMLCTNRPDRFRRKKTKIAKVFKRKRVPSTKTTTK